MPRFILIVVLFLLSLLCIFKAPTNLTWYVEILVTEFPWIFLIVEILLLLWGLKSQRFQTAGNIIAIISFILFCSPIIRAYIIGKNLPQQMANSFGPGTGQKNNYNDNPFSLIHMFTGIGAKQIPYKTMVYATTDSVALALDFYPSQAGQARPCVVVVHGGSWSGGDSRQLAELSSVLAISGYNVASLNYRLVPKYKSPAQVDDIRTAMQFLRAHSNELKIDTNNFVLLGRSAGGHLVLEAAYTFHDPGIKGVIDFYGPTDLAWGYDHPANPRVYNSTKVLENFLGGTYREVPQQYIASSPINFVTPQTIPTLLFHGQNDVLVHDEHSIMLAKKLQENGVKHFLLRMPWATHGFDYTLNGPGGQLSTYCVEEFLKRVIR